MKRENILKQKLKGGQSVIGTWSSLSSPNVINAVGTTGLDFVVIDMEHGSMSFETVENLVRAAEATGISPIVRTSSDDRPILLRTLETGTQSIMVPHVKNADNAQKIVQSSKYFPEGDRGLSPYTRVHDFTHSNIEESIRRANEQTLVGILVEGQEGLTNLERIVEIPGLDLIYLGLFDICQSMGLPGQVRHPKVLDELARCRELIESRGIAAGSMAQDLEYAQMLRDGNYRFIAYVNDSFAIKSFFEDSLSRLT